MTALCPPRNAPPTDMVDTPPELARAIVREFVSGGRTRCLDPARGKGAFYNAMQAEGCQVDWCEINEGRDFLSYETKVSWIITNPPWSKFRAFLIHAMQVADHVVFLAPLPHFLTRARIRDMATAKFGFECAVLVPQPPAPWPSSGFQLAAVCLSRRMDGRLGHIDVRTLTTP